MQRYFLFAIFLFVFSTPKTVAPRATHLSGTYYSLGKKEILHIGRMRSPDSAGLTGSGTYEYFIRDTSGDDSSNWIKMSEGDWVYTLGIDYGPYLEFHHWACKGDPVTCKADTDKVFSCTMDTYEKHGVILKAFMKKGREFIRSGREE